MNSREFKNQLTSVAPEVPARFHDRVEMTLENIVTQEAQMKENTRRTSRGTGRFTRRTAVIALALILVLAAAAVAATRWHVFDFTSHLTGEGTPVNADSLMQKELHQETVNGVEIKILEAGYDGRSLLLRYSFRMPDEDRVFDPEGISDADSRLLSDRHVGWWKDEIRFNGEPMGMPGGSESYRTGSEVPGEIIETDLWRLDAEGVKLEGPTEISLPIGDGTDPEKGWVTFTYDPGDIEARVKTYHPEKETVLAEGTVKVTEASFTPLMTYIRLEMKADPETLAARKAETGEEDEEEAENLAGMQLFEDWLFCLQLTDREGHPIETEGVGLDEYSGTFAQFLFAWQEDLPDELWLAPADDETADMSQAVLVRRAE